MKAATHANFIFMSAGVGILLKSCLSWQTKLQYFQNKDASKDGKPEAPSQTCVSSEGAAVLCKLGQAVWAKLRSGLSLCLIICCRGHRMRSLPTLNQFQLCKALWGLHVHIFLCYTLCRSSRGLHAAPSLCQRAAVSATIVVFQKYGLLGRRGATGRAGRAEWHSWFPVL